MAARFRPVRTGSVASRRAVVWLAAVLIVVAGFVQIIDWKLQPIAASAARALVMRAATEVLNQAISDEVADDAEYARIIQIDRTQYADFKVMHFDFAAVTRLQSAATRRAESALENLASETLWLPLGQVFGGSLFSSVGPRLPVRFDVLGAVHSSVESEVKSTGINQTVHLLYLDLTAEMNVMAPFIREPLQVRTHHPIAYVILSGKVPDTYAAGGFLQPMPRG